MKSLTPGHGVAGRRGGQLFSGHLCPYHLSLSSRRPRRLPSSLLSVSTTHSTPASPVDCACVPADQWYAPVYTVPRQVEAVRIAMLEGKGRGVLATRDLAVGEVVMATPPLVLVTSPQRQRPSGELVVDEILERKLYGSKWFSVLYDGSSRSCTAQIALAGTEDATGASGSQAGVGSPRGCQPPEPIIASTSAPAAAEGPKGFAGAQAPKKKGFLATRAAARRGKGSPAASGGSSSGGDASQAGGLGDALPIPDRREQTRLAKLVKFNCFGDDAEDLAACECRGEKPRGHIGLWPEFALLNHSCAPNAVNYVVQESMVVRACRPIKAGEEVTISYLGRPQLLPFNRRIAALSEDYGFECNCARCMAEQAHYDKLEDTYLEFWEAVEGQHGPAFLEARAVGDRETVREVQRAVQAGLRRLYGVFRKALLAPDVRQYVIASLYDAYDLSSNCAAALGEGEDASGLQACLKAMEVVSGGSDLHVILAVRHHDWTVRQHGAASQLTRLAREALQRAHVARYGPVGGGLMERLVDLNRKLHVEGSGA